MSACDAARLERWLDEGLDREAGAHLERCLDCARELRLLREERALFSERARGPALPLPKFEAVLLASRAPQPRWSRRAAPAWIMGAVAAAAMMLVGVQPAPQVALASGDACFLADGEDAPSAELAEATEDARFEACLVASPVPRSHCF